MYLTDLKASCKRQQPISVFRNHKNSIIQQFLFQTSHIFTALAKLKSKNYSHIKSCIILKAYVTVPKDREGKYQQLQSWKQSISSIREKYPHNTCLFQIKTHAVNWYYVVEANTCPQHTPRHLFYFVTHTIIWTPIATVCLLLCNSCVPATTRLYLCKKILQNSCHCYYTVIFTIWL